MEQRPDPDELLKHAQAEEQAAKRGKLKIFLGYAAGVGKTYAMLEAAHQRKIQGIDVVVGFVETHKRAETEELVEGLDVTYLQVTNGVHATAYDMYVETSRNAMERFYTRTLRVR